MEAIARSSAASTTQDASIGAGDKLSAFGEARRKRDRRRRIVRGVIGIGTVLVLWQVMAVYYGLEQILPPPLTVARTIFNTLTLHYQQPWLYGPNIYEQLAASLARAISGFTIAAVLAIPLGLLLGRSRAAREFVDPVIRSLYPIPGIAWIPLAILWFGLGNATVIFVVVIAEFFPLYFNTEAGARNINPTLIDAARCFGAKRFTLFRRVILPASIPFIIVGMRIALGGAWRMIVAGEMLASESGIGSVLMESRFQFRANDLMMAMILISIVGLRHRAAHHRHAREEDHRAVGSEDPLGTAEMHAISKIIARHAGKTAVEVGEIVNVVPDFVMLNDRGAARAADLFRQMGGEQVFDPDKVVVVFDHHYPPIRPQDSVSQKQTREWIKRTGHHEIPRRRRNRPRHFSGEAATRFRAR